LEVTSAQLGDVLAALALMSPLPPGRLCLADTAYDANGLQQFLSVRGSTPVIPKQPDSKALPPFDPVTYRQRNLAERMSCRLKDWRRTATRYVKPADNFARAAFIAAPLT
jgi:transposase